MQRILLGKANCGYASLAPGFSIKDNYILHMYVVYVNCAILFLLRCPFQWCHCLLKSVLSVFGRNPWTIIIYSKAF